MRKQKVIAGGEKHVVYKKTSATGVGKGKKGHIMVNHPTKDKGEWDTIDLTEKSNARTVKQGVAATRKWHKENPYRKAQLGDTIPAIKGSISPVPNGPLVKKTGQFKGSTLRNGGKSPAWQRKEGKNSEGGLNAKGVASYRRANPGSKLKTAVTTKPSKLKPGSKSANRRKSFCARMSGMKKRLTSAKTANDPNSRINKSLRKWNC